MRCRSDLPGRQIDPLYETCSKSEPAPKTQRFTCAQRAFLGVSTNESITVTAIDEMGRTTAVTRSFVLVP